MVREPGWDKGAIWVRKGREIRIKKGGHSASYHGCTTWGIFSSRWEYMMISCYRNGLWNVRDMSIYPLSWLQGAALRIFFVEQLWLPFPNGWQNIREGTPPSLLSLGSTALNKPRDQRMSATNSLKSILRWHTNVIPWSLFDHSCDYNPLFPESL